MSALLHTIMSIHGMQQKVIAIVLVLLLSIAMPLRADDFTLKGKVVDNEENALEARDSIVSQTGKGRYDKPERGIYPHFAKC